MARKSPEKDPASPEAGIEQLSFEQAIDELESIVARMEQGELSLQDSLQAYQRGAALVTRCRGALATVQEQVKVLEGDLLRPVAIDELDEEQGAR